MPHFDPTFSMEKNRSRLLAAINVYFGKNIPTFGICWATTYLFMQAYLTDHEKDFTARMDLLKTTDALGAREKILQAREKIKNKWPLSEEDEKWLEMGVYFENIIQIQKPFLKKNKAAIPQEPIPNDTGNFLGKFKNYLINKYKPMPLQVAKVFEMIQSQALEEQGGMSLVDGSLGFFFDKGKLTDFLEKLSIEASFMEEKIAIHLNVFNIHGAFLGYDPRAKKWTFADVLLPKQKEKLIFETTNIQELTEKIFQVLSYQNTKKEEICLFSMGFYGTGGNFETIKATLDAFKKTYIFEEITQINKENIERAEGKNKFFSGGSNPDSILDFPFLKPLIDTTFVTNPEDYQKICQYLKVNTKGKAPEILKELIAKNQEKYNKLNLSSSKML